MSPWMTTWWIRGRPGCPTGVGSKRWIVWLTFDMRVSEKFWRIQYHRAGHSTNASAGLTPAAREALIDDRVSELLAQIMPAFGAAERAADQLRPLPDIDQLGRRRVPRGPNVAHSMPDSHPGIRPPSPRGVE